MMRSNEKGLSLVELLVGLFVTAIVVLMVAAIGTVASQSYANVRYREDTYNDTQFSMQMMREAVRQSTSAPTLQTLATGTCLIIPETFVSSSGKTSYYDRFFYNQGSNDFFWGTYCSNSNGNPSSSCCPNPSAAAGADSGASCSSATLCSSIQGIIYGATNLVFTPNISALPLVSVTLNSYESNANVNYSINVTRRNP